MQGPRPGPGIMETQVGLRGGGTEISGERQGGLKKAVGRMAGGWGGGTSCGTRGYTDGKGLYVPCD